jgi:hypothetical protein
MINQLLKEKKAEQTITACNTTYTGSTSSTDGQHKKKLPLEEFNHEKSESTHDCSVTNVQIPPSSSIVDPKVSAKKSPTNKSTRTEMHSEWKHHHYHGEPQQSHHHHHQGLTLTSNLASQQVLNVDVSVPVAAPVSLTLDAFKKTQAPSSSSVLPFDLFSNISPSARIQQDGGRGYHALDCQKFSSHSTHASIHHSVSRSEQNFYPHLQEQRQENNNVLNSKSQEHHNCDLAEVSIVPDHLDIDDDDNHPPPTPQFDSNAMQQFHDVQPHQVQVDIHNSNVYSSQNRHHFQETMIPFPSGGGYGSLQNSIPYNYDCNSQMNGQHGIDAEENNEEEQFEKTLVPRDTLEVLKAIPLCTTAQEFEQKYPVELAMIPPDMTPIQHPTHSDILFGRGGLTNHHPGMCRLGHSVRH